LRVNRAAGPGIEEHSVLLANARPAELLLYACARSNTERLQFVRISKQAPDVRFKRSLISRGKDIENRRHFELFLKGFWRYAA
jgi:hypothetical protein